MTAKDNCHVINNLFSIDEVDSLKKAVYGYYNNTSKVNIDLEKLKTNEFPKNVVTVWPGGKAIFNAIEIIPNNIKQKLIDYVLSHKETIDSFDCFFTRYSKEFGSIGLGPHIDDHDVNFKIDYQLESNRNWDLIVENNRYCLKDNSALVFSPSEQVHWRAPVTFNDKEYVDMIFFDFTTKSQEPRLTQEEKRKIEKEKNYELNYLDELNLEIK